MNVIILDGSHADDPMANQVRERLTAEMTSREWVVETVLLREKKIGNCAGDFFCWIRTPGICNVDDDNREIARAIIASDLLVYLTPVTFGGYSSILKRMVDHQLQNVSPFFESIDGETRHKRRYERNPDLLAIGWMNEPDARAEAIFRHLAWRNSINLGARTAVTGVAVMSESGEALGTMITRCLDDVAQGRSTPQGELPVAPPGVVRAAPNWLDHALLLLGSPRLRESTSNALGSYLLQQLASRNVAISTLCIHTSLGSTSRARELMEAVDSSSLVILAFPLFWDTLPAPVIEALERIARHRRDVNAPGRPLFCAIGNCGFPEAHHLENAMAVCETFSGEAGFEWAGGLALGGGEGLVHGTPLRELGGRAMPIRLSLEIAAEALATGQSIPDRAVQLMRDTKIPPWMYRLLGGFGMRQRAKAYGAHRDLGRQPYATATH